MLLRSLYVLPLHSTGKGGTRVFVRLNSSVIGDNPFGWVIWFFGGDCFVRGGSLNFGRGLVKVI